MVIDVPSPVVPYVPSNPHQSTAPKVSVDVPNPIVRSIRKRKKNKTKSADFSSFRKPTTPSSMKIPSSVTEEYHETDRIDEAGLIDPKMYYDPSVLEYMKSAAPYGLNFPSYSSPGMETQIRPSDVTKELATGSDVVYGAGPAQGQPSLDELLANVYDDNYEYMTDIDKDDIINADQLLVKDDMVPALVKLWQERSPMDV